MKPLIHPFPAPEVCPSGDDKAQPTSMWVHQSMHALRKCLRFLPLRAQPSPRSLHEACSPYIRRKGFSLAWMTLLLTAATTLTTACTTTREVQRIEVRHDTLRLVHRDTLRTMVWQRDSVHQRDTVYRQGTTLIREHWHDRWHWRHDTLRLIQRDTLSQATHHSSTERSLTTRHRPWWRNALPIVLMLLLIALVAVGVLRTLLHRFVTSN